MLTELKTEPGRTGRAIRYRKWLNAGIPAGFYRSLSWQYVGSFWAIFAGGLYSVFIGRGLGAADFGLITLGLSSVTLVFLMASLRLHEVVIRYVAEFWEHGDHERTVAMVKLSFIADLSTCVLALLLVVCLSPFAEAHLLRDHRSVMVLWLSAFSVFFVTLGNATSIGILRVFGDFKTQSLVSITTTTFKLALSLAGVFLLGWRVRGVLVAALASSALSSLCLMTAAIWRLNHYVPLRHISAPITLLRPRLAEIARFARSLYFLSLTGIPTKELDVNILGYFAPLHVVGTYKIAKNFMTGVWALADPTLFVVYPELARMWSRKDLAAVKVFVHRLTAILGVCGVVIFVGAFAVIPRMIQYVLGNAFHQSGVIFCAMLWPVLIWFPLQWVNPLLMAAGRPDLTLRAAIAESVIVTIMYFLVIPKLGAIGAACVYALATPLVLLFGLWLGRRAGLLFSPAPVS